MGTLYYGDNLDVLQRYIGDETIDLVYLDPPFNSAQTYNAFFQRRDRIAAVSISEGWRTNTKLSSLLQSAMNIGSLSTSKRIGAIDSLQ